MLCFWEDVRSRPIYSTILSRNAIGISVSKMIIFRFGSKYIPFLKEMTYNVISFFKLNSSLYKVKRY